MSMIWVDLETTGLDPGRDGILEMAVVVTDEDLNELDEPFTAIVRPTFRQYREMSDFVREMHDKNGLLAALDDGMPLRKAWLEAEAYLQAIVPKPGEWPLAGNNVGFDRGFLHHHMPTVEQVAHYRNIDVSTVKELARRWCPRVVESAPEKAGGHRALGDVLESIDELRHYRDAGLFDPTHRSRPPMPATDELIEFDGRHASVPLVQVPEITYPAPAAASGDSSTASVGHPVQCKVCKTLLGLPTDQRARVVAALEDDSVTNTYLADEFCKRGSRLSSESVRRHRKASHEGVR